ncbi:DUF2290 domain-containing protein [Azospirillum sp. RWY-5-1]|uniref:DUF2290 domain-containing protein n=1 Tax=Azospirillum oleiclasticum TaxID=2735135 RepID=A0ABX2T735_9PROT|nr:DUF2290 domain-containing protein [Azospirillum oleiclasticum]NYZ11803.1 DUF2290 domain-containing protein [Azospirillum oleiclasticum]NYZ18963.1 DUF2290 domain-containing protein [Azospirillum oleiclasticum]
MKLSEFNSSIRTLSSFFAEVGLWKATVYMTSLPRSEIFNKTCLTSVNYVEIYEAGLSLSHYNILLHDYAYFQFSHTSETEYALAYYPNPRLSGCTEAVHEFRDLEKERDNGILSAEEFDELVACMPARGYVPRIRFEYSAKQYRPVRHPGAHFHIGMSGEDRWCSGRKLSPRSFGMLMAKFYYPEAWWSGSRFSLSPEEQETVAALSTCFDERLLNSIKNDGVSQLLTDYEKMGFHLSALLGQSEPNMTF